MLKYCIKRLLLSILILLGVSLILYILVSFMPVDYFENQIRNSLGGAVESNEAEVQAKLDSIKAYYGLDSNVFKGYFNWLTNLCKGDLGNSFVEKQPVEDVIFRDMGVSFGISFVALILQLMIAIPLGIKCACNQYGKLDYFVTVLTMIGISFPTFFLGGIVKKIFASDLGWFEPIGLKSSLPMDASDWERFADMLWHLVLPMFVLVVLSIGGWMRYTRTNTLEVLNADYIRTARAKGLNEKKVIYHHAFRNTLIPTVTILGGSLPALFSGALITETLFGIPGIGYASYHSMVAGDIPFSMFYLVFMAIMTLLGNLITDVLYAVVDPRVRVS